ncbi:hypothetical protein [Streptomyces sp. NPDC001401]|uniref:hypothetical protein n=1 Tax=Streptomyces sp. NPDC001401 TaxID=3364570 RepID=UPI003683A0F7
MRTSTTRPRRLALGIAVLTAAALGTVSASAAQASGTSTTTAPPAKAGGFAVQYHPTASAPDDVNTANDYFAACMEDQGQSVFPHFHASKDDEGHVRLEVKVTGGEFDPTSKAYKKAVDTCGPMLEKAGITFPNPADLPPLPGRPGKPGEPGKEGPSLRTEKGGPGDDDLPGLTTSVRTA